MCDAEKKSEELPTLDELRKSLTDTGDVSSVFEREWEKVFQKRSVTSQEKYTRLKGLQDHFIHKGRWSNYLMFIMTGMIGFQSYLLIMVGQGRWDFTEYSWLLPALLAQNLAQVIGLAVFVVRALFTDPK